MASGKWTSTRGNAAVELFRKEVAMRVTNKSCLVMLLGIGVLLAGGVTQNAMAEKQTAGGSCDPDCNQNGIPDPCDLSCSGGGTAGTYPCLLWFCGAFISCGMSDDCNGDGIPDTCQLAGNDCNGNGVPDECDAKVACCASDGTCSYVPAGCCTLPAGVSAGPGSTCSGNICTSEGWACCKPNHQLDDSWCDNHSVYTCTNQGGTLLSTTLGCDGLLAQAGSDIDFDGILNVCDNCPEDHNIDQLESDADEFADACDNCPFFDNPGQANCDETTEPVGVEEGDCCDVDDDGDGILDVSDVCQFNNPNNTVDDFGRPEGDFNGNCVVDDDDLARFMNNYNNNVACPNSNSECDAQ